MHSCIFEGSVSHCRFEPIEHRFQYRLYMLYLDLAELPELVGTGRLISSKRVAGTSFLESDHLSGMGNLDTEVRSLVELETGQRPSGPVRMLTQLRYFGYYFSPLNLFYVFSKDGLELETIVAEVNNTPWGERQCYVLWSGNRLAADRMLSYQHEKQMHVSPFMGMKMDYRWRIKAPSDQLSVALENICDDRRLFAACLNLNRLELNRSNLRWVSLRYPLMTAQIITAIHFQALKLWWKKCPVYQHPNKTSAPSPAVSRN
jgi:uncharacterized protein